MPRKPATPKSDNTRRALRTGFQAVTVQVLIQLWNAFATTDVTTEQAAILTVVGTPLLSFIQNWLESRGAVPTMLKGAPPADALVQRELEALAAAFGTQHADIERLENALFDLRADRRPAEPDELQRRKLRIREDYLAANPDDSQPFTEQGMTMPPWPPGGLG